MYSTKTLEDGELFRALNYEILETGKISFDFDNKYKSDVKVPDRLLQYYFLRKAADCRGTNK
jgi:hypothetical protein